MATETPPIPETRSPLAKRSRLRDLLELSVGYLLIMIVIWTPRHWQRPFYIAAVLWVILATCVSFDGWKVMGWLPSNPWRGLWIVLAVFTLVAVCVPIAARLQTLHAPPTFTQFIRLYWGYAIWACLQQFLLLDFFLLRLLRLRPNQIHAAIAATTLFGLAHLPNPILTPLTLLWGLTACFIFLRDRNLYPLAVSHAALGICVAITVPGQVDHNMRVGLGYLTYRPHSQHQRSQNDHIVSTAACVIAEAPTLRSWRQARP